MFENIKFNGTFRSYQQSVLDNADKYLNDGKIHIVAAPGSGKTILGLELIVRLKARCIILSPTTTIRNQWGERFYEHFTREDGYVSYDLKRPKAITSVTYQALHAAMKRATDEDDGTDYAGFDLIKEIKRLGVKTVCLDEAHHLQNEWQKALEQFLKELSGEVKIIALTATPPYDAKAAEWNRYVDICGEIDEEIFVPELVKQNSLCPHQDYVYFNYPTDEEAEEFALYKKRAAEAVEELEASGLLDKAYENLIKRKTDYDFLYSQTGDIVNLLTLCEKAGIQVDKKLIKTLTCTRRLPSPDLKRINAALNYLAGSELLNTFEQESLLQIFKSRGVTERGEISLELNEKLKRKLISSVGKLKSISEIVKSEAEHRKDGLRMLILTDYIKKESLNLIGTDETPNAVNIVSVFETVRRTGVSVGALSGSLVILPNGCEALLRERGADFTATPLGGTDYSVYDFNADNREKVRLVSRLFESNAFSVLVGTKSLLGEGWDAPCVNSLILASFVGGFMLSNQMRGRAIRIDKNDPDKTASIWHLVTLERPKLYAESVTEKLVAGNNKREIVSCDYETLSRRFDCFVAPNYDTGEIESGISRITVIKPPYDEKGVAAINAKTIELSRRGDAKTVWQAAAKNNGRLNEVSDVPRSGKTPPFVYGDIAKAALLLSLFAGGIAIFISCILNYMLKGSPLQTAIGVAALIVGVVALAFLSDIIIFKILKHISPLRSIRTLSNCILDAMRDAGLIDYYGNLHVDADPSGMFIKVELSGASVHDQNLFHKAIEQLLSPIENPRYLLIPRKKTGGYKYDCALACPEILGSKNEYAKYLANRLKRSAGKLETVYTRTEKGRKLILKCRNASYITKNYDVAYRVYKHVSNYE